MYTFVYDTVYDRLRPYTESVTVDLGCNFDINSIFIYKRMSITSLTICNCDLFDLLELFKYIPMLKKLHIGYFHNSKINDSNLNLILIENK
jgi:hypothetical protein